MEVAQLRGVNFKEKRQPIQATPSVNKNKRDRLCVDDLLYVIRKDKKKITRAQELLVADEEIKRVKRVVQIQDDI